MEEEGGFRDEASERRASGRGAERHGVIPATMENVLG